MIRDGAMFFHDGMALQMLSQLPHRCEYYLLTHAGFTECNSRGQGFVPYSSEHAGHGESKGIYQELYWSSFVDEIR